MASWVDANVNLTCGPKLKLREDRWEVAVNTRWWRRRDQEGSCFKIGCTKTHTQRAPPHTQRNTPQKQGQAAADQTEAALALHSAVVVVTAVAGVVPSVVPAEHVKTNGYGMERHPPRPESAVAVSFV